MLTKCVSWRQSVPTAMLPWNVTSFPFVYNRRNSLTLWKSFVCISYTWWFRGAFFVNPCIHPVPPPPECIAQSPGQTVWYVYWKPRKIGQETKLISSYNSSSAIHSFSQYHFQYLPANSENLAMSLKHYDEQSEWMTCIYFKLYWLTALTMWLKKQ